MKVEHPANRLSVAAVRLQVVPPLVSLCSAAEPAREAASGFGDAVAALTLHPMGGVAATYS